MDPPKQRLHRRESHGNTNSETGFIYTAVILLFVLMGEYLRRSATELHAVFHAPVSCAPKGKDSKQQLILPLHLLSIRQFILYSVSICLLPPVSHIRQRTHLLLLSHTDPLLHSCLLLLLCYFFAFYFLPLICAPVIHCFLWFWAPVPQPSRTTSPMCRQWKYSGICR